MRYDRDIPSRYRGRGGEDEELLGRGEYGDGYEAPYRARRHGYGLGYGGGSLRSRGSFEAGQLRSGLNPVDEFEFEWGEGYVGGRGYGGTNYDYEHGYQVGPPSQARRGPGGRPSGDFRGGMAGGATRGGRPEGEPGGEPGHATRGGFSFSEYEREPGGEVYGPARYGYGPYHERLRRRRRSDDELREEVEETLFYDTWVDADRIAVEVQDGIVTLRGTLPSYDEVRYATDDAWDVDGVRGVRSELQVDEQGADGAARGAGGTEEPAGRERVEPEPTALAGGRQPEGDGMTEPGGAEREEREEPGAARGREAREAEPRSRGGRGARDRAADEGAADEG